MVKLRKVGGQMLCGPHARTGAPLFHTPGCVACEKARARGVVRPVVSTGRKRGARGLAALKMLDKLGAAAMFGAKVETRREQQHGGTK